MEIVTESVSFWNNYFSIILSLIALSVFSGGAIYKVVDSILKRKEKKKSGSTIFKSNISNATQFNLEIFYILNEIGLRFGPNMVKVITAMTSNGGGVPKAGYPTYVRILLENPGPGTSSIAKYWTKPIPATQSYTKMISQVIDSGIYLWDPTKIEEGPIKDMLDGQGILKSWVFALGVSVDESDHAKDGFMFLAIDFNNDFRPNKEDRFFLRKHLTELKSILNKENTFTPYEG